MGRDWDTFNKVVNPQGAYEHKKGFEKLPRQSTKSMAEFFIPIWQECLRVLKPGAFAFVMCSPRQDVLSRQIVNLHEAGFNVGFSSIYWAYAEGFPKAENIGKTVDKRGGEYLGWFIDYILKVANQKGITRKELTMLFPSKNNKPTGWLWNKQFTQGITIVQYNKIKEFLNLPFETIEEAEREVIGKKRAGLGSGKTYAFTDNNITDGLVDITKPATFQAEKLDGSYGGFQPKPAVEVIIVAMKPLSEKTYVEQALKSQKGITWLDDGRIPIEKGDEPAAGNRTATFGTQETISGGDGSGGFDANTKGRFPANLLVSDDILNDGRVTQSGKAEIGMGNDIPQPIYGEYATKRITSNYQDMGSFSRYFDLDKWWAKTFPFFIVSKPSKGEKNRYLEMKPQIKYEADEAHGNLGHYIVKMHGGEKGDREFQKNYHPTVKPLKLMTYLVTIGSRPNDIVLDPFVGSGTTAIACQLINRNCIGIDNKEEYLAIAIERLKQSVLPLE